MSPETAAGRARPTVTVDDHLRGQPPESVALYRRLADVITGFGEVTLSVSKTTITFTGPRRGFAGGRPTRTGVRGYFDLTRDLGTGDPRIRSVSPYQRRLVVHQFILAGPEDLDDVFTGWLREAYDVGCGAHLGR